MGQAFVSLDDKKIGEGCEMPERHHSKTIRGPTRETGEITPKYFQLRSHKQR